MEETKAYRLIQGWRGKPPANLGELEATLVNFSNLVADFPEIAEIDINPLAISGGRPHALSARIILDENSVESPALFAPGRHPVPDAIREAMEDPGRHGGAPAADQARGRGHGARIRIEPVRGDPEDEVLLGLEKHIPRTGSSRFVT